MMRTARLSALLLALALLAGCAPASREDTVHFTAMDTVIQLSVYGCDHGEEALSEARQLIQELDGLLSTTDEGSQIHALNQGETVALAQPVQALLERALALCADTGGAFDITIYPVVRAWGFTTDSHQVPTQEELSALLARVDYRQVEPQGGTLTLPQGVELDLGGVAKGYASQQVARLLREEGVDCALIDLGGSIQAIGSSPDGDPWSVGIRDPRSDSPEDYAAVVRVTDQAVVTSGMYERYFEQDGVRYGHIIDPDTGYPVDNGLASVTIVAADPTLADALSTALFVMGRDGAAQYWRGREDFEFVLMGEDGSITISEGLEGSFSLAGEQGSVSLEVIRR